MNRFPSLSPAKLLKALKRAGFIEEAQKGSHVALVHLESNCRTTIPMHSKDIKRGLLKAIIKQAGLTESELRKFL